MIIVTSQVLYDGVRNVVMQFTGRSDGEGQESNVVKVDASELAPPARLLKITKVTYDVAGGVVQLLWGAITPTPFLNLSGPDEIDYCKVGGLTSAGVDGPNGDILLSTIGFEANGSYSILLEMVKRRA